MLQLAVQVLFLFIYFLFEKKKHYCLTVSVFIGYRTNKSSSTSQDLVLTFQKK